MRATAGVKMKTRRREEKKRLRAVKGESINGETGVLVPREEAKVHSGRRQVAVDQGLNICFLKGGGYKETILKVQCVKYSLIYDFNTGHTDDAYKYMTYTTQKFMLLVE